MLMNDGAYCVCVAMELPLESVFLSRRTFLHVTTMTCMVDYSVSTICSIVRIVFCSASRQSKGWNVKLIGVDSACHDGETVFSTHHEAIRISL